MFALAPKKVTLIGLVALPVVFSCGGTTREVDHALDGGSGTDSGGSTSVGAGGISGTLPTPDGAVGCRGFEPSYVTCCDDVWRNLFVDPESCGACGARCPQDKPVCFDGICEAAPCSLAADA